MTRAALSIIANKVVPRVGLGCMGMSEFYGAADDAASLGILKQAWQLGYRSFDTADMYGLGANEELVAKFVDWLGVERKNAVIATKVGIERSQSDPSIRVNSKPAYVRLACERSLRRLRTDAIDLLYLHRRQAEVPIEDTVGEMARLVTEGKVKHIGLSEVSEQTLRAAAKTSKIDALQCEYSLWTRDPEKAHLPACRELGVQFVAYSPLGRGFLTGRFRDSEVFASDDLRRHLPRFDSENAQRNARLVNAVQLVAQRFEVSPGQIALSWVLSQDPLLQVIPGTRNAKHLAENYASVGVQISQEALLELSSVFTPTAVAGERYPAHLLHTVNT